MNIKIFDRKRLHMHEHFIADFFKDALRNDRHDPAVKKSGEDSDQIYIAHFNYDG
ncbi:hypothetical protein SDC9_188059 [bioreactor metagenome]|uniref:Uncharacterized protein n=1 Tax=bioreactor metagenome TaxID=1076179 RepID=A0A645HN88_9ZZZZ